MKTPAPKPHRFFHDTRTISRTFADVARGAVAKGSNPAKLAPMAPESPPKEVPMPIPVIREMQEWLGCCTLVGETKSFDTLCNFPALISMEGFDIAEIKYVGGLQVLMQFKLEKAANVFKANRNVWLKWFTWVDSFGKKSVRFERVVWIKITGIPIVAWDESNFAAIAARYGTTRNSRGFLRNFPRNFFPPDRSLASKSAYGDLHLVRRIVGVQSFKLFPNTINCNPIGRHYSTVASLPANQEEGFRFFVYVDRNWSQN
ncbi:hypothetical protein LXL04_012866 [Taraxacum kok-saghyz]